MTVASVLLGAPGAARAGDTSAPSAEEAALLKADADFCQLSKTKGVAEAFFTYAADDAVMLIPGMDPVKGKAAIKAFYAGMEGLELTWKPLKGEVARSGDLGYSYGTFEIRHPGSDGSAKTGSGKYNTVWKKQADGGWKFVLDIGNSNPAS